MLYKVAANTELANTKSLLPGEIQDSVPSSLWSQYFDPPINM